MPQTIYLDHNATTPVAAEALEAMLPWFRQHPGNPSSLHARGEAAADAVRAARVEVARLVGGAPDEVAFTSGGSESIATAFATALARDPRRRKVVVSATEHSAVQENAEHAGPHVVVGVDREGRLDRGALFAALDGETALVSLMSANNETGVVTDLEGVGEACRAAGALLHVDAIQAPGKLPLDVRASGAHLLSLSAHKFHGPQGVGALWADPGVPLVSLVRGGPQERGRRAGTENVPGIVGMGVAARLARAHAADPAAVARLAALRDALEQGVRAALPDVRVHGALAPRVANTTNLAFPGLEGTTLLALLSAAGVAASAGSACHAEAQAPSPVLLAMGASEEEASSSLRFSLSRETTPAEVERAVRVIIESAETLRALAG